MRVSDFLVAPKLSINKLQPLQFGCTDVSVWLHRRFSLVAPAKAAAWSDLQSDWELVGVAKQLVLRKMRPAFFHERPAFFHERAAQKCPRPWDI